MKIAYIAAGAADMYCGSCLRDNALAKALRAAGHDCLLVPTYTPLRTDEPSAAMDRVFYGGISVFLEQSGGVVAAVAGALRRFLDSPPVLKLASRLTGMTDAHELGELTVSVLQGEDGRQNVELDRLVDWLAAEVKPDLVNLPNALFVGLAGRIKSRLNVPVFCTLSGEDLFIEGLPDAHRRKSLELIRKGAKNCAALLATSHYYADATADLFAFPREHVHAIRLGLTPDGHGGPRPVEPRPPTVGYFARICPAKGLHVLVDAFRILRGLPGTSDVRLRAAGYLGPADRTYLEDQKRKLRGWNLADAVDIVGEVDRNGKIAFLKSVDVLSVPTVYRESKGLYVLEALANGTPVVQPAHGAFPELIEATGGGIAVTPGDPAALAEGLHRLLTDAPRRRAMAESGQKAVLSRFTAAAMAQDTAAVYRRYLAADRK
jgi:glycosyltransferase involved in cell wall biosynthesis